jgi:DNA-binding CsgD family transcriptional regulator
VRNRGLTAEELHRAAFLAHDTAADPRGDHVPQALLEALVALVPCFDVSYAECDQSDGGRNVGFQDVNDPAETNPSAPYDDADDEMLRIITTERSRRHLYDAPGRAAMEVVRTFDFYSEREWRSSDVYCETYRPFGEWTHALVPLPRRGSRTRNLIFMRSRDQGTFSDRDRDLLMLLQPQLTALADARQHERNRARLTARQREVLHHVAAGLSTEEIARELCVSSTTVRKHLENIFLRLGVSNRAAAVARGLGVPSP